MTNEGDAAKSRGDVMRRLRELEGKMREMIAGRRLENASVGEGGVTFYGSGGITLLDGGGLTVDDGGGINIRDFGRISVTEGGSVLVEDQSETFFFYVGGFANDSGFGVLASDSTGHPMLANDRMSTVGLARPWLPVPLYPKFVPGTTNLETGRAYSYANLPVSELSGETTLWEGRASVTHPMIQVGGTWGTASGTNSTTYRVRIDGDEVGSWSESSLVAGLRGPYDVTDYVGRDWLTVELTAEETSNGDGNVACQPYGCFLRQT